MKARDAGVVYLIKTEIISKEMDKSTDRVLLVILTLGLCVFEYYHNKSQQVRGLFCLRMGLYA